MEEAGGGFGGVVGEVWQDSGVGVGGQRDAGVAEQGLDGAQVVACGEGEAGGSVAEVVQPYRRKP
ncbi:hypothetical protein QP939_11035 [Amycolatopsis nalaikhensis]|uniref:Uncharacterized protein n=1 Tax=Amycolatopsis nalaikhensis TaxID=715472 RepID=A0ABY8XU23_9PSEU|nr:hypothetical protein [Amycolatopsis sp. 2-2]WIV59117.1 hypothetical protein QP939_11035 [Amycolatopsis sp. 2-2]